MFGIMGYGRPQRPPGFSLYDFSLCIYPAGKMWLNGLNPYAIPLPYPYPPNSALLCMLLAATSLETARMMFLALNICCIGLFAHLCLKLYNIYNIPDRDNHLFLFDFKSSLLIAMIIGNVFVVNILWVGQTTILFSTALLASYYFYLRSCEIPSGILLALALNKPQLAYTFLLWLVLEKKWKTLVAAMISSVLLGIVPIYNRGIVTAIRDWVDILPKYTQFVNQEGLWNQFGLQPLFLDFGININSFIIFACSIILVILIHQLYRDINKLRLFGMLTITGLLLGQAGQYDLIIIFSLLPYYLINIPNKDINRMALLFLTLLIVNFPRKLLFLSDYRILHHHREITLIIALLFLLLGPKDQPRDISVS